MLATMKNSVLRTLVFLTAASVCAGAFARNSIDKTGFLPHWKRQAALGREFSYPTFHWHKGLKPNGRRFGWVESGKIYEQLGLLTWQADFVVREIRSDSEAILEVHITQSRSDQPNQNGTFSKSAFLFRGFKFEKLAVGDVFTYSGGVISSGTQVDAVIEPAVFAPLPKHKAELGVGIRTWTDDSGQHSVQAALDAVRDDKVRLVKEDGRAIEVPIAQLSVKDQLVVRKRPEARLPAHRPKRSTSLRRTSSPRRHAQSFREGLNQKINGWVAPSMAREMYSMRQGFYQARD